MTYEVVIALTIMFGLCLFAPIMFIIDHFRYSRKPVIFETNLYVNKLQVEGIPAKLVGAIPMVIVSDFDMENMYISK